MSGKYGPAHNLILTAIVTIACGLLNLTSLMIGGPAVVCAIMVRNSSSIVLLLLWIRHCYIVLFLYRPTMPFRLSVIPPLRAAIVLSVINIVYAGVVTILVVGLTIGLYCDGK